MTEEDEVAPQARSMLETIVAINLFINGGLSPQEALDMSRRPEGDLGHDGETWTCRRTTEDG